MKKIYALLLTFLMMFSFTACSSADEGKIPVSVPPLVSSVIESTTSSNGYSADDTSSVTPQTVSEDTSIAQSVPAESPSAIESSQPEQSSSAPKSSSITQSSSAPKSSSITQSSSRPKSSSVPQSSLPPQTQPEPEAQKILVAYFSATNTTKGVAKRISDVLNADLYEIVPAVPYTSADLNYNNSSSRSTIEMNDPNSRPAISGSFNNMEQYDIVFLGYPIWWGEAPRILSTFVESYSLSGKTVVPFCTSGSSGVGSSAMNLERLTSGARWLSGTRLNGGASEKDIVRRINGLGLDITAE